jgi:hypothetical protein
MSKTKIFYKEVYLSHERTGTNGSGKNPSLPAG